MTSILGECLFTDLIFTSEGSYSINAFGDGLVNWASEIFVIKDYYLEIIFDKVPASLVCVFIVEIRIFEETDLVTAYIGKDFLVDLELYDGSGSSLIGSLTTIGGVAVFSNLQIGSAGDFYITADGVGLKNETSSVFTIQEYYLLVEFDGNVVRFM